MEHSKTIGRQRRRRSFRVRKRLRGTSERPRLSVHRSHRNISVQIINDLEGKTLVSASTIDKELLPKLKYGGNRESAELVGRVLAERAVQAGIKKVCFDRGVCKYHGRVAALAEAARAGGLEF
jgi:large subunit ribosomal protein L18